MAADLRRPDRDRPGPPPMELADEPPLLIEGQPARHMYGAGIHFAGTPGTTSGVNNGGVGSTLMAHSSR